MKKETSKRLTREQLAELKSLAALPDSAIDTSDAPELLDWSGAKRGLFYRPVKQQLTLRLDADVVAWFKRHTTFAGGSLLGKGQRHRPVLELGYRPVPSTSQRRNQWLRLSSCLPNARRDASGLPAAKNPAAELQVQADLEHVDVLRGVDRNGPHSRCGPRDCAHDSA
jgi:uncharacterized protein (DUF4415 family)